MVLRTAEKEDAKRLLNIYSYYVENTAISFEYEPPSLDEFRERISNTLKKYPYIVLEDDGMIRGYAYAGVFKGRAAYGHCCEVTIYLDRDSKGKGYGRALYTALEEALRKMGMINLYACIAYPVSEDEFLTKNSEQFHRHMGYTKVGEFHKCGYKFGRWYNMIWMEKVIGEHR
ncbi:MAG: GNAT family N-acetyltransferase [Lachnospiraceae bacterium]|nr:GNAT family N-acetyltransferase [Lachnospiraceae bacterium]